MGPKKKKDRKKRDKKLQANIDPDLKEIHDMERLIELQK
jgi:hypothetical protein